MRIIAGIRRGLVLGTFDKKTIRPTKDMVKEFMFNCLATRIDISAGPVLDLFAGSGNLGIEALSRGAPGATFVENDPDAVALIRRNLTKARFEDRAEVVETDAMQYLERPATISCAVIFSDAPYDRRSGNEVLDRISSGGFLITGGILILETSPEEPIRNDGPLAVIKQKKWGESLVTIFQKNV